MAAPDFWLGTSWKMTKTLAEARAYVDDLAALLPGVLAEPDRLRLFLLPPHTALATVCDRLDATFGPAGRVLLGAQNAYPGPEGPMTGEVSMGMVRDAGATLVEIGHAERRTLLGETDDLIAAKVASAVAVGLTPLICVGETLEQRRSGKAVEVVTAQLRAALTATRGGPSTLADTAEAVNAGAVRVLVAYEPHWAIGASRAVAPEQGIDVVDALRRELASTLPDTTTAVLYGGSVDDGNAHDLVTRLPVDGLFVGRAAWTAKGLVDIARRCSAALGRPAAVGAPTDPAH